jgi:hypothetical protein
MYHQRVAINAARCVALFWGYEPAMVNVSLTFGLLFAALESADGGPFLFNLTLGVTTVAVAWILTWVAASTVWVLIRSSKQ